MCACVCGFLFGQRLILSIQGAVSGIWSFENLFKSFNTLQTDHNDKPKAESRAGDGVVVGAAMIASSISRANTSRHKAAAS